MKWSVDGWIAVIVAALWSTQAFADPCRGALPAKGAYFSGAVRYVGDGDGLCVGPIGRPDQWIEVRLGDFFAPELHEYGGKDARLRLEQLVIGRGLTCRAGRRSYDRVVGYCTMAGKPLGELLRQAGKTEGGRGRHR